MTTHARRATEKKLTIVETMNRTSAMLDIQSHATKALTLANEKADQDPSGTDLETYFIIKELREVLVGLEALRDM